MCGIFGYYVNSNINEISKFNLRVQKAQAALKHRGPDDQGLETFEINSGLKDYKKLLFLGHVRLSIIDLSPLGHQPMHCKNDRYVIVYNGEVYNYRELREELKVLGHSFRTESDTEVLLSVWDQWGAEGLKRIIGMFAFAVFDRTKQTLTLVRDAFGIKPLFYKQDNNSIYFASELPALLKLISDKPSLNLQRSYDYLVHGDYDSNADTFVKGINHLLPAHYCIIDLKTGKIMKDVAWWKPSLTTNTHITFGQATKKLKNLFLDSVNLHLRSDVPLGIALSGGIDSSSIASVARYLQPNMQLNTFSYIASDPSISEEKWIDSLNKKINAKSHKIIIKNHEIKDCLYDMILKQGEPFSSTSVYAQYRVAKLIKATGVKVILDGQGADEILAGYLGYPGHKLLSLIETKGWLAAHKYAKYWAQLTGKKYILPWLYLVQLKCNDWFYNLLIKKSRIQSKFDWLNINYLAKCGVSLKKNRIRLKKENRGQRVKEVLAYALTKQGLQSLLRHSDRNSMAFSIESRVPFLTIPIVDFLLSLPENFLISNEAVNKHIFRESMRGIVPNNILDRKDKIGFAVPETSWLSYMPEIITKLIEQSPEIPFINKKTLLKNIKKAVQDKKFLDGRIWRLINYFYWLKLICQTSDLND